MKADIAWLTLPPAAISEVTAGTTIAAPHSKVVYALSKQARSAARKHTAAERSAAAKKAARTKVPVKRSAAAKKAARTRMMGEK